MARGFPSCSDLKDSFRLGDDILAATFRSVRAAITAHKAVRHMAMTVTALHVSAKVVDYYITKYAAKPMEQLQNLVTQYALGLRRLEAEEKKNFFNSVCDTSTPKSTCPEIPLLESAYNQHSRTLIGQPMITCGQWERALHSSVYLAGGDLTAAN